MQTLEEGPARSPGPPPKRPARSQPDCVLSIGFQNLPAAIIEERGGTLVVLIQGSPQFWVDDSGQLKTPETDLEVRVFNMVRVEAEDGDPAGEIPKFRIGLERMGTVANEEADDADGTCADEEERDEGEAALKKAAGIPLLGLFASLLAAVALGGVAWACQHYLRQWIFSPAASHQEQQTDGRGMPRPPRLNHPTRTRRPRSRPSPRCSWDCRAWIRFSSRKWQSGSICRPSNRTPCSGCIR